jgi:hypothetical protein
VRSAVGGAALSAPYIMTVEVCTTPGSRATPETVAVCPLPSVTSIMNGPGPAPEAAIQYP